MECFEYNKNEKIEFKFKTPENKEKIFEPIFVEKLDNYIYPTKSFECPICKALEKHNRS